jgi:hypothetical protein
MPKGLKDRVEDSKILEQAYTSPMSFNRDANMGREFRPDAGLLTEVSKER